MPTDAFAAAFPVLRETAYLNAGTCGPLPTAAGEAIAQEVRTGVAEGRGAAYYERLMATVPRARAAWSSLLGAPADEISLTAGASDGIVRALGLVDWKPGDEILTSDEEHGGLLGPLGGLVRNRSVRVRVVPFDGLAAAVTPATRLVAVSHVSWLRGAVADLEAIGRAGAPVLVDGAQSAGAIPVDLGVLRTQGVVAYAAAGQKWTCGPVGTGALWVEPAWAPEPSFGVMPVYPQLEQPSVGLESLPWPDARRLDAPSLSGELLAGSVAALGVLETAGWAEVHAAAITRAGEVAQALQVAGMDVAERGASTLVAWRSDDPPATVAAAASAGVIIRDFAGQPWVRASIGAWTSDAHAQRLLTVAGS